MAAEPGGFGVRLDARPVLLPDGSTLLCPSRRLAEAVAEEWNQASAGAAQEALPLTALAATMWQDQAAGTGRAIRSLLRFAATDLLCYRARHPEALAALQAERWQPWLDWLEHRHGVRLLVTEGVMPVAQPEPALSALRAADAGTVAHEADRTAPGPCRRWAAWSSVWPCWTEGLRRTTPSPCRA